MTGYTSSAEKEKPTTKISLPSKDLIEIQRRNQKLYRQAKAERIQHHQTRSLTNAKSIFSREETQTSFIKMNPKEQNKW